MGRRGALILLWIAGCGKTQLLVTVTTDLVLPGEADPTISRALVIDRVFVEDLSAGLTNQFPIADQRGLPLSFGVVPGSTGEVSLQVTGFDLRWADADRPLPNLAVTNRMVLPVHSFQRVRLALNGDCIGQPCDSSGADTRWAPLRETACQGAAPEGMICIPGGASVVGDRDLTEVDPHSDLINAPPRMVVLKPFFFDSLEVTVARLRPLVDSGTVASPPLAADDPRCNYTRLQGGADKEAARCVPFATARAACVAWGGDLPTSAQWEHAARGRGQESRYPWGDSPPDCNTVALNDSPICHPSRTAGSHATDRSRDGVFDLGGGVREWVLDSPVGFDTCLSGAVLTDPLCDQGGAGSLKGGSLDTPPEAAAAALRRRSTTPFDLGFRCVH